MRARAFLLALSVLLPGVAAAQTTAELQAIGQQAAAQSGVPWSVFEAQIQAESGWNPSVGCNSYGACGIAQFIPSTAASLGVNTADPASSLYGAAAYDAQLYQHNGSWVAALTAYSGGLTPANPGDYGPVFAAAIAAGGAPTTTAAGGTAVTSAGEDGLTVTSTVGTAGAATAGTAAAGGGVLDRPFEWAYQQLITGVIGQVNTSINQVETLANGPLSAILVLAVIVMGIGTLMGRMPIGEFKSQILRMAFVIAFVAPGNAFYQNWVENAVLGLPTYFANGVALSGTASSTAVSTPARMFDAVYAATWANAEHIWHETPWSMKAVFIGMMLAVILVVIIGTLISMFFVFAAITFLALVMLCVGPVFILALLFRGLDRFLRGFVDVMVTLLIMLLIIDIVLGFFMTIMVNLMATFAPGSAPNSDLPGFAGMAIVLVVMGYSMTHLARLVERVGGGVTIALDSAGYWMRGQALADAARLASRTAGLLGRG